MDKKTAIIVGVIILVLTSVVTPFLLRKITNKANNITQGTTINENEFQDFEEMLSGEVVSNDEQLTGSGDECEEKQPTEFSGEKEEEKPKDEIATSPNETTSSQGTTNQTTESAKKENNVPANVVEEKVTEKIESVEIIEVVNVETNNQNEEIIQEQQEIIEEDNIVLNAGEVGILKIDKIGVLQPVVEGHSLEVLKKNLGHFDDTAYFNGNIGVLGHNNGNAGFFKRLDELKLDDVIEYTTEKGTKTYKVSEIVQIDDTDWSRLSNTKDNRITLITCVKNVPNKRLCVQAIEI